jgi:hypothetical protein
VWFFFIPFSSPSKSNLIPSHIDIKCLFYFLDIDTIIDFVGNHIEMFLKFQGEFSIGILGLGILERFFFLSCFRSFEWLCYLDPIFYLINWVISDGNLV